MALFPIVDSHIHLYASSHISRLNWTADLPPDHPLNRQSSVDEYKRASKSCPVLRGFVFLETDHKSGLRVEEWDDALDEVNFLGRIASGTPHVGEGHIPEDKALALAIIPWAPVPAGPAALSAYMALVKARLLGFTGVYDKIRGVRYLVQDKAPGTMLRPDFIDGLNWLGDHSLTFDLGVDARSAGIYQLRESCEMLERVHSSGTAPRVIINHLCKPNLRLSLPEVLGGHPEFTEWKQCIQSLASIKGTYMKLSGLFSELPPQGENEPAGIEDLVMHTKPWIDAILGSFGPSRIMFGSDWPVCNVGGPGLNDSWNHYVALVSAILDSQALTNDQKARVWSGTAIEAYNITLPSSIT